MNYEIKSLSPDLVNDYLSFFDLEEHSDNMAEHKCFCVCWCSDDHRSGLDRMSTAQKRRELAEQYVKNGKIKGYLAFEGNRVVGWCNANKKSECRNCISWLRSMRDLLVPTTVDERVKSVFCFTVANDHRRTGVATQLLKRVCEDAKEEGYQFVEAYPKKAIKGWDDFEGPLAMYQRQGFVLEADRGDYLVLRKYL